MFDGKLFAENVRAAAASNATAAESSRGTLTRSKHCTFCDLIHGAGEASICYEDADALAFMDVQPVNPGHVLVVSRAHYESFDDLPAALATHLFGLVGRLVPAVKRVANGQGINVVVNSGRAAGQDVPHFHVHIIPRTARDGFDIPLPFQGSEMPDRTLLDATAVRIMSALRDPTATFPVPVDKDHHPGRRSSDKSKV